MLASSLAALHVTVPMAHGIEILPNPRGTLTVAPLLTTGDTAYLKENINQLTTLDRESTDIGGPFDVAVAAEEVGQDATTRIIWVASGVFLTDNAFQASEGANASLLGELLGWMTPLPRPHELSGQIHDVRRLNDSASRADRDVHFMARSAGGDDGSRGGQGRAPAVRLIVRVPRFSGAMARKMDAIAPC